MPHVGTWIEIAVLPVVGGVGVVPHVGTWIEIDFATEEKPLDGVVPHVGTWIEIMIPETYPLARGRASRRHVD